MFPENPSLVAFISGCLLCRKALGPGWSSVLPWKATMLFVCPPMCSFSPLEHLQRKGFNAAEQCRLSLSSPNGNKMGFSQLERAARGSSVTAGSSTSPLPLPSSSTCPCAQTKPSAMKLCCRIQLLVPRLFCSQCWLLPRSLPNAEHSLTPVGLLASSPPFLSVSLCTSSRCRTHQHSFSQDYFSPLSDTGHAGRSAPALCAQRGNSWHGTKGNSTSAPSLG